MSHWCGKCDFRDTLSINFNDNFNIFLQKTKGIIYQIQDKKLVEIVITCPADLIPYYAHIVVVMITDKEKTYIEISEESYLDTRIKEIKKFNEKYPIWHHSTVYYECQKQKLKELYEREKKKNVNEQLIIDN